MVSVVCTVPGGIVLPASVMSTGVEVEVVATLAVGKGSVGPGSVLAGDGAAGALAGAAPAVGHATFPVPPPTIPSTESTLFSGPVTIHAGPFADVTGLALFEQALRAVPNATEVSVRKLKDQRAVIDLELAADVPLVFELRRASDHTFDVDHAEPGRLDLTIHAGDPPFPVRP